MTNSEKYKKAFSVLEPSDKISWEVEKMKAIEKKRHRKIAAAAVAIVGVLVLGSGSAYAANVGGIQRQIQLWTRGELTDATITFDGKGGYTTTYTDENGETQEMSGGGIAYDIFGNERPLTEDELMEDAGMNDVEVAIEDGRITVYFMDQVIDITDKFKDGICHVHLTGNGKEYFLTVGENGNYTLSEDKYMDL